MSWQDRLRSAITLTSPDGTAFSAQWAGDDIEFAKRVGQYDVPLVDGTLVQDMGAKGTSFPLTLSFEGPDNDVTAFTFCRALAQRGTWTVVHPVYGSFTLQPIGPFTLAAQPTQSGNITTVTGPWIEPLPPETMESAAQMGQRLQAEVAATNAAATQQFIDSVDTSAPENAATLFSTGMQALAQLQSSPLAALLSSAQDLKAQFDTAIAQVQSLLSEDPVNLDLIATQFQTIMGLPALAEASIESILFGFAGFSDFMVSQLPGGEDYSSETTTSAAVSMSELILAATLCGVALAVSVSSPETRDQALKAVEDATDLFDSVRAALDAVQTASEGAYVSQAQTTASLSRLEALISAYLMGMLWDLAVARRFTLDRPRAVIEIAITEYQVTDKAQIDTVYDLVIRTNALTGDDVIELPAGREVVIYEGLSA